MADINPTDLFLINRNDKTYKVAQQNLMAELKDTDYMVINRNDISYKVTGREVIDSLVPKLNFNEVTLSTTTPSTYESVAATVDFSGGVPPYTFTYTWYTKESGESPNEIVNETLFALAIKPEYVDLQIACKVIVTDAEGQTVEGTSDFTDPVVSSIEPPRIGTLSLTENNQGVAPRFANQSFKVTASMLTPGVPQSEKALSVSVKGQRKTTQVFTSPLENIGTTPQVSININQGSLTSGDPIGLLTGSTFSIVAPNFVGAQASCYWGFANPINLGGSLVMIDGLVGASSDNSYVAFFSYSTGTSFKATYGGVGVGGSNPKYGMVANLAGAGLIGGIVIHYYGQGRTMLINGLLNNAGGRIIVPNTDATLRTLTLSTTDGLNQGEVVYQQQSGANGQIRTVASNKVIWLATENNSDWRINQDVIGSPENIVINDVTQFVKFDSDGTVTGLQDDPINPPFKTTDNSIEMDIQFPESLSTDGSSLDELLLPNTSIKATLVATSEGSPADGPVSTTVTPDENGVATTFIGATAVVSDSDDSNSY